MARRQSKDVSLWFSKSTCPPDLQPNVLGTPFTPEKELLAAKSAKFAALLKNNSKEDLSHFLRNMPADPETLELVARFYHGFELQISTEKVVPLICVAHYLEMTENHSKNNLLGQALSFFQERILPSWNETVKAFRTTEKFLRQSLKLGLVEACMKSIITKALANPCLLGEPIKNSTKYEDDTEEEDEGYKPSARRRLFDLDWKSEDLTTLSLELYEPVIHEMNKHGVPSPYVAASLCNYTNKWVLSSSGEAVTSNYKKEILEAVERHLPHEKGLVPCTLLFEILRFANVLEVSSECRNGIEIRIGKQLDQAAVKDLLIPSQGYSKEMQYDIVCVRRILKVFYGSYTSSDISGLISVAELIEDFLAEVASDIDLNIDTFVDLAEMSLAASLGTQRTLDGIYRAVDIYLDKHRHLTESEREEVCRVLDFQKVSPEAYEHAAKNEKLPLRVVVQVLFAGQLQLRDRILKEVQDSDDKSTEEEAEDNEAKLDFGEEEMRSEMEKMSMKVMELERECNMMRKEIDNGGSPKVRKEKTSLWREMKRKFGCVNIVHDSNCQLKKKKKMHPKQGV
ncbi:BTB/POZ domain-containing protein At5g17580-like [Prunus avium]|uniref:BTB/POZ domain-containing protein At5g17580-like n=1 Tax=Prunus avium TaxID=42229 RepID=A0A6P5SNK1_PRUAV|nr:BTB/POZ domain-containing protein At5g17580-like [Prunus avium]